MRRVAAVLLGTCALLGLLAGPAVAQQPRSTQSAQAATTWCPLWQVLTGTCPTGG